MTKVDSMLLDIAHEQNGYSIGDPWRFTQHSLAAVVPLIRVNTALSRAYRLLAERKTDVKVKDTGNIEQIQVLNVGEYPILIKTGEVLIGSTQSRTVTISQVIMPEEKVSVACACVYSSKGIREGQGMTQDVYSPIEVRRAVYSGHFNRDGRLSSNYHRDQSGIWGSVNAYSKTSADRVQSFCSAGPMGPQGPAGSAGAAGVAGSFTNAQYNTSSDDLAGRVKENTSKYKDILKEIPKTLHQVGIVLLTISGMESLESFEHPDSWEGLRREILGADADKISDISNQDNLFEFRPEKTKGIIRAALTTEYDSKIALEREHTQTIVFCNPQFIGEVVTLDSVPIHCAFVKKDS